MPKRFAFVNYGNSREGSAIADALKEEGYFVYSTRRPDPKKLDHLKPDPLSIDQFIDSDKEIILKTMKQCHAVIYTILDTPKLANELFTELSTDVGQKKTIVIVSPIFTWAGQPRAEDWKKRWPHPNYTDFLSAERYLTTLPLRLYVMSVGLLYGDGEDVMLPIFQSSWGLKSAPMLEQNRNVVPTLHVQDMARGAVTMIASRPEVPVIVAHDGSRVTQRDLIKAINSTFGAGRTAKVTDDQFIQDFGREAFNWLTLDLELEAEHFASLDFERHCSDPAEEMQTLVNEFVQHRILTPLKILAIELDDKLIEEIVQYYGVVYATNEKIKKLFENDKSEEAAELRPESNDNEEEEEDHEKNKENEMAIKRHILENSPYLKNLGYLMHGSSIPKDEEDRENFFMEDEEPASFMPKYILTSKENGPIERWFIARGSHCAKVQNIEDVKKFLGLPRNFTREVRIIEDRRRLEQIQSEEADNQRKAEKKRKAAEEAHRQELLKRDEELLAECEAELKSMEEIRALPAKEFLMSKVVPMFMPPLAQINEARPDDPLRFLASHFETEVTKSK